MDVSNTVSEKIPGSIFVSEYITGCSKMAHQDFHIKYHDICPFLSWQRNYVTTLIGVKATVIILQQPKGVRKSKSKIAAQCNKIINKLLAVFLQRQIWIVNYKSESSSENLSNENKNSLFPVHFGILIHVCLEDNKNSRVCFQS